MKSTLTFTRYSIPAASLNGESSLPNLAAMSNGQQQSHSRLDETDGLFVGYGFLDTTFPYRLQDNYDRALRPTEQPCAVLENEHLRATFFTQWGGRLWSLFDKDKNRELTFCNSVLRPGNLAVNNAWVSGGIEFNCGMVGHHPFTCSPVFVAETALEDGTPVLRMYEYERIRGCVYQMDFFLPADSKVLFGRMRIVNPGSECVPMYWWTNIAVPEIKGARVVTDAVEAYTNNQSYVMKVPVPEANGTDLTYPTNLPFAVDYFWHVRDGARRFVCQLDPAGYGLVQASTARLKGRKLFVWGQGPGGDRWQQFLTGDGQPGRYTEIQAGLACSQYECLPMPPQTAWEWLECYGALQADGDKIHADWDTARAEATRSLDALIPQSELDERLTATHAMATSPARTVCTGSGWGRLENLRRAQCGEPEMCPHLDFGQTGPEQQPWETLLATGKFPEPDAQLPPVSWMLQKKWLALLRQSVDRAPNYAACLQLGAAELAARRFEEAKTLLRRSIALRKSPWALFGLACAARAQGDRFTAADAAVKAYQLRPGDASLAKEALHFLTDAGFSNDVLRLAASLPAEILSLERVKLYVAFANVRSRRGDPETAQKLLREIGESGVPDIREGENSVTDLWFELQQAKAERDGNPFDREHARPPKELEFRMFVSKYDN